VWSNGSRLGIEYPLMMSLLRS